MRDGEIWGRGALDMKGQVAGSAVAIASLAREGFEPNGDLIFVAAADEEVGVDFGCSWLCREHPDAVRAEYVLNEGAGDRVEIRREAALPVLDLREDDLALRAARARAGRARIDAGYRRQCARQGGQADPAARRVFAPAAARAGGGGLHEARHRRRRRRRPPSCWTAPGRSTRWPSSWSSHSSA